MEAQSQNDQESKKPLKNWAIFSGIGLQMGLTIFLGNIFGKWLDSKFSSSFLEESITLIAVFTSMYLIIYRVNKLNKND